MENLKNQHGGKREGAGRKKLGAGRNCSVAFRISEKALNALNKLADKQGKSKSDIINQILEELGN